MIHCWAESPTPRSARIFGSATLTMVPSTKTTTEPRMQAISVRRLAFADTAWRLAFRRPRHGPLRHPHRQSRRRRRSRGQAAADGRGRARAARYPGAPRGDHQPRPRDGAGPRRRRGRRGRVHPRRRRARRRRRRRAGRHRRAAGRAARRARQRLRPRARHPARPGRGGARPRRGARAQARPRRGRRPPVHRHRLAAASTRWPTASRTRRALVKGNLVYLYAALRALAAWKPARFELELDGEARVYTGWSVGACNSKAYGGGMYAAPNAELDDGLLDVVVRRAHVALNFASCACLPRVFKGTHVELTLRARAARARGPRSAPTGRSASTPTATRSATLPVTVRVRPGALTVLAP